MKEETIDELVENIKGYKSEENVENLLGMIDGYLKAGLKEEAKRYLEKLLKISDLTALKDIKGSFPDDVQQFLNTMDDTEAPDEDFDANSFLEMGELLWEIGSPEEARDNYLKAFEYHNIHGDKSSAGEILSTLKERYPDDDEIAALTIGNPEDKFLEVYEKSSGITTEDEVDVRYALARKFHEQDLLDEAEENYIKVLDIDKDHKARRLLVSVLKDMGNYDKALDYIEGLEDGEKVEELYSVAGFLEEEGRESKAKEILREILNIKPDYRDVREKLGVEKEVKEGVEKVKIEEEAAPVKDRGKKEISGIEEVEPEKIVFL